MTVDGADWLSGAIPQNDDAASFGDFLGHPRKGVAIKSVEAVGLPFEIRSEGPSFERLSAVAYKAPIDSNGAAVLPADWDDDDE